VERIFRIFYDDFAGGAICMIMISSTEMSYPIQSNNFRQILVSSRLPNFSTHTITMEAVESMLIKGSER